ncbi:MAG TPA: hypothetical protein VFS51_00990 [Gemmatimonadales bacterium]|nr:hypothetical protein [Gemmatimonadales bacterium]
MSEGSPARIDRAALERIIQRAAELQTTEREIGDSMTSDELIALGREVGIPGRYLQQALLEERTRLGATGATDLLEKVAGPGQITAQRVVAGDPHTVEQDLLRWIESNELFCVQRQQAGRITWEPLGGIQAAIRRSTAAFGSGKRPFMLSRAATVSATVIPLESGYTHVSLSADTRNVRNEYLGTGAAFAGAGAASAAILVALGALLPLALLPLPVAVGVGYATARRYRPAVARIHLGLERALDFLEQGAATTQHQLPDRTAGILGVLADEVRKALKS